MRCTEFEEQVSAFLEDELDPDQARRFGQHAEACPACLRMLRGVQRVRAELRLLGGLRAPAHYQLRLAGRVNDGLARPSPWLRWAVLGATVAAALAILLCPQLDLTQPRPAAAAPLPTVWAQHARAWAGSTVVKRDIGSVATGHAAARRPARYSQAHARYASY